MVPTELETLVKGQSSSDRTDQAFTGLAAGANYIEDGFRVYESVTTTFRGLAAISTTVSQYLNLPQSKQAQKKSANRVGGLNAKWQAKAIKALESFGTGTAR
jgi:hypothetical protein